MQNIELSTPALLFPAISLLMLAFTNRFLAIASLIRQLHKKFLEFPEQSIILDQIKNLKKRLFLIKGMQASGLLSFASCVMSMIFLFNKISFWGGIAFVTSMCLLLISLSLSIWEISISTGALELELKDMEKKH